MGFETVDQAQVERAVRDAVLIGGHLVAGGPAAAAAEAGELGMDEDEGELRGVGTRPLAAPGRHAVDLQPQGGEVPGLAHVEPGERLGMPALPLVVGDQQRRT